MTCTDANYLQRLEVRNQRDSWHFGTAQVKGHAAVASAVTGKVAGLVVGAVGWAVTSVSTAGGVVAEPVRVHRLTDQEGQKLQQILRRGSTSSVRYRRIPLFDGRGTPARACCAP